MILNVRILGITFHDNELTVYLDYVVQVVIGIFDHWNLLVDFLVEVGVIVTVTL